MRPPDAPTDLPPLMAGDARDHDGALHRGVLAGRCLAAAHLAGDPRVPATSIDVRFAAHPASPGSPAVTRLDALRVAVATPGDDGRPVVEGTVELAGHDVGPRVADLVELGGRRLPPVAGGPIDPGCWGCGTAGPLQCRPLGADAAVATMALDDRATRGGGRIDPAVVAALLTCPATWLSRGQPPDRLVVRWFGHAPAYEPVLLVARRDPHAGVRVALLDDDRTVVAVAATEHRV